MRSVLLLILAAACTDGAPEELTDEVGACVVTELRTYDEVDGYYEVDPVLGLSPEQVDAALLGSFTGSFTPAGGSLVPLEAALGFDGPFQVVDTVPGEGPVQADCGTELRASGVITLSTAANPDGTYLVDDIWTVQLVVTDLESATLFGSADLSAMDGNFAASLDPAGADTAEVSVSASFGAGSWTGDLSFFTTTSADPADGPDGAVSATTTPVGSFTLSRAR